MSYEKRTIETSGFTSRKRKIDIFVYDSLHEMRTAAVQRSQRFGTDETHETFRHANGVTEGLYSYPDSMPIVNIRLERHHLQPEIVSHEVAHAVMHIYRVDCLPKASKDIKKHFSIANELFAYLYGEVFGRVMRELDAL